VDEYEVRRLNAALEEVAQLRCVLEDVNHTLAVHGHIDANTDLHKRVQAILEE